MKTIVIIGGGITGLTAAYTLQKLTLSERLDCRIVLAEAGDTLGGKIHTVHGDGFIMETGADSIVSRKTNVAPFLEELGLQDEVVYNATGRSFLYVDGRLKPIPEDAVFGIPLSIESLAKSELVSAEGKVEALKDFYTPNETFTKDDSVGRFLKAFLGEELVDKQIAPVLSGVYSGDLNDLTIASTLPYLLDYKNEYGSIIKGLSENQAKFKGTGHKKFISFRGGLSMLVDVLEQRLTHVEVRKRLRAERIARSGERRYRIGFSDGSEIEADAVVVSTMHTAAQSLFRSKELDQEFDRLKTSSLISVYIGFDVPDEELRWDGTGFITSTDSSLRCNACTWTSRKWEHTSPSRRLLVRLFYKSSSPHYSMLAQLTEAQLLEAALQDVWSAIGLEARPVVSAVTKWEHAMPNYSLGHHEIVRALEKKLQEQYPGVLLAGCSYYGVGIPDCIANGEAVARKVIDLL